MQICNCQSDTRWQSRITYRFYLADVLKTVEELYIEKQVGRTATKARSINNANRIMEFNFCRLSFGITSFFFF